MKTNLNQRKIKIITEIHPQHMGSMSEVERMILQSKISGADIVKVQLYSSKKLFNDAEREYLDISKKELTHIKNYCENIGIELSASIFDEEKLSWCEELNFKTYKIASRTVVDDLELCQKIIQTNKRVIASLGMYDFNLGMPFKEKNIEYLYCVSKYPTMLDEIKMPNFNDSFFVGYSDHTVDIDACIFAMSKGSKIIEKHFSNNKSINVSTQLGHFGSMDADDLQKLRKYADSFSILRLSQS